MKQHSRKPKAQTGHVPALAHALNCVPDFVLVTDRQGRLCFANYACLTYFGYAWEEIAGRSPSVLFAAEPTEVAALFRGDWSGELSATTKLGDHLTVVVDNAIIRNPTGRPLGVVSIFRNVTAKVPRLEPAGATPGLGGISRDLAREKLFEQQLLATQKMATVSSLAGGIAHEFNNLLTGILGYAELLAGHVPADAPGGNYLEQIKRAALEATELIRELSVFSQMAVIDRRTCDLAELVREALALVTPSGGTELRFVNQLPAQMLPCEGDSSQLRQAIVNILLNACEAMPVGGVLTTCVSGEPLSADQAGDIGLGAPGRYVCIRVTDEGPGMDEALRRRACEPFFSTKGPIHTGLGLTTAYSIVQKHGGALQLESAVGRGTTVRVYLPESPGITTEPAGPDSAASPTVLLVEDEEIPRQLAAHVLEGAGYRVLAAGDGEQGLQLYREHIRSINLIVTDIIMPRLSGDAMVAEIRKLNRPVRILAVSGYTRSDAADRLRALGVDRLVQKPFTGQVFLDHVRQLLTSRPAE